MNHIVNIANIDGTYKMIDLDSCDRSCSADQSNLDSCDRSCSADQSNLDSCDRSCSADQSNSNYQTITLRGSNDPNFAIDTAVQNNTANIIVTADRINDMCGRVSTISKILSRLLRTRAARYFTHNEFDKYADELDNISRELDSYI